MKAKAAKGNVEAISCEGTISRRTERKQVEDRLAIGANVVCGTIRREGEDKLRRPAAALAWSVLAAGLSMGFSFIPEGLLAAHLRQHGASPGFQSGLLNWVLDRDPRAAAALYGNYPYRHFAIAVAQGSGDIVARTSLWGVYREYVGRQPYCWGWHPKLWWVGETQQQIHPRR